MSAMTMTDAQIVTETNKILSVCALDPRFCAISDIQENASSICVAILERLLQQKLTDIARNPQSHEDYIRNAGIFLQSLQTGFLSIPLPLWLTPQALCGGAKQKAAISVVLSVLAKLVTMLERIRQHPVGPVAPSSRQPSQVVSPLKRARESNYDADNELNMSVSSQHTSCSSSCSESGSSSCSSATSLETETADRSPIYRPQGFQYETNTAQSKPKRAMSAKRIHNKAVISKRVRPRTANCSFSAASAISAAKSSCKKTSKVQKTQKRQKGAPLYKKVLSAKLSLEHKQRTLNRTAPRRRETRRSEEQLLKSLKNRQRERVRSDMRWLSRMESKLEREVALKALRSQSGERAAIERVESEARKLEKEYLRNYHREYKRKFVALREEMEAKTASISSFFRAQYDVLAQEKAALAQFDHLRAYSDKVELSKLKRQLKAQKEQQLQQLCGAVHQLDLADKKDIRRLNKMIREIVENK